MLTTTKLDQLLRIILISVTLGNQRGFDRAALFLVDEKENVLQGMMGVGARDRGEVDRWRQKLAEQNIFSPDWVLPEEMERTPYDLRVRQARVSLDEEHSILVRTVREKRSFNVENAPPDPEVNPRNSGLVWQPGFCVRSPHRQREGHRTHRGRQPSE